MTVQLVKTAKPVTSIWLNPPGTLHTMHFDRSKFGKRVAVTFWRDNGEVELRAIHGDARGRRFVEFDRRTLPAGTSEGEAWATARAMAEQHFAGVRA